VFWCSPVTPFNNTKKKKGTLGVATTNRYPNPILRKRVADYLYELLNHHLAVRSDNTRNIIRLLSITIAYPTSRRLASTHLAGIPPLCELNHDQHFW
jgi:hypothetical protein